MMELDSLIIVIDSLELLNQNLQLQNNELVAYSDQNKINIWRTIGSSGIIITLFLIERLINYRLEQKNRENRYFQEIVIKPNIERITSFFTNFYDNLDNAIKELRLFKGTGDQNNAKVSELLAKLKSQKTAFDYEFLSLVRAINPQKANLLTDCLNSLEDIGTNSLTSTNLKSLDLTKIEAQVHILKAEYFRILNMPEKTIIQNIINTIY